MKFFNRKKPELETKPIKKPERTPNRERKIMPEWPQPSGHTFAQDHALGYGIKNQGRPVQMHEKQQAYFFERGFIGYAMCAYMARHWVVDKACNMPARDAVRNGWELTATNEVLQKQIELLDKKHNIRYTCREFVRMGRVFGGQLALFDIANENPQAFYENPFNLDGVTKGSYRGIVLIDPADASPILTSDAVSDPASPRYMQPTYWQIGGRKYHYSHLMHFAPYPVAKMARHAYNYFGVSVPERIYERVFSAEKTADEALLLAMTKRMTALGVAGLDDAQEVVEENIEWLSEVRDNFGILLSDSETTITQLETSLTDLDTVIMTQYQLVAAAAGVQATKLIETTPKGFNSTGDYEEAVYREVLESIQENDLTPLLERHYQLAARHFGSRETVDFEWHPLDSPTAKELAEIESINATTIATLVSAAIIDGETAVDILAKDKGSMFFGIDPNLIDSESLEINPDEIY